MFGSRSTRGCGNREAVGRMTSTRMTSTQDDIARQPPPHTVAGTVAGTSDNSEAECKPPLAVAGTSHKFQPLDTAHPMRGEFDVVEAPEVVTSKAGATEAKKEAGATEAKKKEAAATEAETDAKQNKEKVAEEMPVKIEAKEGVVETGEGGERR